MTEVQSSKRPRAVDPHQAAARKKAKTETAHHELYVVVSTPPAFDVTDDKQLDAAIGHLREHGYARLSRVASSDDVKQLRALFWEYVEELNPKIRRDDARTWNNKNWPGVYSAGMFRYYGIGNSRFMWTARTLPGVRRFYERLYGTDKLLVSFDGCGVLRGAEHKVAYNRAWLHTDLNPSAIPADETFPHKDRALYSVQGSLQLFDAADPQDTGSFLVVPGSHREFLADYDQKRNGVFEACSKSKDHWYKLPADSSYYRNSAQRPAQALVAQAGDFFVWSSALVHANWAPTTDHLSKQLRRLQPYITMAPASRGVTFGHAQPEMPAEGRRSVLTLEALVQHRRIQAFLGSTSSHWPTALSTDNVEFHPRAASSTPLTIPASCYKSTFSLPERALLTGTSPSDFDLMDNGRDT